MSKDNTKITRQIKQTRANKQESIFKQNKHKAEITKILLEMLSKRSRVIVTADRI
jgi:hypothetical protein